VIESLGEVGRRENGPPAVSFLNFSSQILSASFIEYYLFIEIFTRFLREETRALTSKSLQLPVLDALARARIVSYRVGVPRTRGGRPM